MVCYPEFWQKSFNHEKFERKLFSGKVTIYEVHVNSMQALSISQSKDRITGISKYPYHTTLIVFIQMFFRNSMVLSPSESVRKFVLMKA